MKRNILTIFLASPSDLQEERKIVRDTVNRVNKVLSRRVGWHIELLGWEDTLPGYSRPQSLINKDVDTCQLFLGILWRRWGQETGEYSSGFEEEFIRAQERRKKTRSPEMWLFFKAIDEESAKDPGEQLKKVLNFKNEKMQGKELLFKEFDDAVNWETVIYDDLLAYVLDLSSQESEIESQEESLLAGHVRENQSDIEPQAEQALESYPADLIKLFNKVDTKLKEGKPSELDMSDRTRLYLQASAWFSEVRFGNIFGNHEINIAYKRRIDWEISTSERWFLVRSFIANDPDNRPGWYWLKEWDEDQINYWITWIASNDTNIDVRRAALSLLADIEFKANRELLEKGLKDNDKQIILETIRLLRNTESLEYLDLIDKVINSDDSNIRERAISTRIEIMYLTNPNAGFSLLIDSGAKIPPLIKKTIEDMSLTVDDILLFEALKKAEASVRRFSAQYLRKAKLLAKDKCHELLIDTDARVRKEGLLELIELDEKVDMDFVRKLFPESKETQQALVAFLEVKADDFGPLLLKKRDPDELLSELDFYNVNDKEAYRILALDYFDIIEFRIRDDLDQEFETLKTESEARLVGHILTQYKPDLIDFMRHRFISAALDGLARNGKQEDVKYARKYLGNTQYNIADKGAIGLLSRFGDSSDVENLIKVALKNYGQTKHFALETAYKLSENKDDLLERLINDDDNATADIAVKILSNHESARKIEITQTLFKSKIDKRRIEGFAIVSRYYDTSDLEKLLYEYISQQSYYYNIVTWLDRCLYSKGQYLKFYKSKLSNMIDEKIKETYNRS